MAWAQLLIEFHYSAALAAMKTTDAEAFVACVRRSLRSIAIPAQLASQGETDFIQVARDLQMTVDAFLAKMTDSAAKIRDGRIPKWALS